LIVFKCPAKAVFVPVSKILLFLPVFCPVFTLFAHLPKPAFDFREGVNTPFEKRGRLRATACPLFYPNFLEI
jgi:hypothetical protein